MKVVAIDFETANSQRCSACSIGIAVADENRNITCHHFLIKPVPCDFNDLNIHIHGITPDDVINEPTLPELWPQIWPLLDGALVIAHNAPFDVSVLRASLDGQGGAFSFEYVDTCAMARDFLPNLPNHKLNTLCDYFNIELDHHKADSDSKAALELFFRLLDIVGYPTTEVFMKKHTNLLNIYKNSCKYQQDSNRYAKFFQDTAIDMDKIYAYKAAYPLPGIANKSFCLTGKYITFDRQRLFELIRLFGGIVDVDVTCTTDFLIKGNIPTTKKRANLQKAEDLQAAGGHIQIITEDNFWKMIPTNHEEMMSYRDDSIKWEMLFTTSEAEQETQMNDNENLSTMDLEKNLEDALQKFKQIIDALQLDWGEKGYKVNVLKDEKSASVYFFDTKIGAIKLRGKGSDKRGVFSVEEKVLGWIHLDCLPPCDVGKDSLRTHHFPITDDITGLLLAFYQTTVSIPPDDIFGCCHLYEQCSDAGHCLQGIDYKRSCSYAKNLEAGRIFYGKNHNID